MKREHRGSEESEFKTEVFKLILGTLGHPSIYLFILVLARRKPEARRQPGIKGSRHFEEVALVETKKFIIFFVVKHLPTVNVG